MGNFQQMREINAIEVEYYDSVDYSQSRPVLPIRCRNIAVTLQSGRLDTVRTFYRRRPAVGSWAAAEYHLGAGQESTVTTELSSRQGCETGCRATWSCSANVLQRLVRPNNTPTPALIRSTCSREDSRGI
jgi:hypothetical protein